MSRIKRLKPLPNSYKDGNRGEAPPVVPIVRHKPIDGDVRAEIIRLTATGMTDRRVAACVGVSESTVRKYRTAGR